MTLHDTIVSHYDREAEKLCESYESLDPADLYPSLPGLLPPAGSPVIDLACGSGRDAAWLARSGYAVTASEPSPGMLDFARRRHGDAGVTWIPARLPGLEGVPVPAGGYRFFLAAAVWMHLTEAERHAAWRRLAEIAAFGGTGLVTLRHGPAPEGRPMFPLDGAAEARSAKSAGFREAWFPEEGAGEDALGRGEVTWQTLAVRK